MSATASESLDKAVDDADDCDPVFVNLEDDDDDGRPLLRSERAKLRRHRTRR